MATTRLMPLHTGKGRTVGQAISAIIDYTENPQKTDGGRLITSWQCDSRIADAEFLFTKNQYIQKTGRVRGEDDVIAYHLRQSFVPGEITPEEANRLGCELAKRFTKGNHAYIVCTHIDKAHIHNHVIWNLHRTQPDPEIQKLLGQQPRRAAAQRYHLHRERLLHRGESEAPRQELQQVAGRQKEALPPGANLRGH